MSNTASASLLAACLLLLPVSHGAAASDSGEINVYSARKEALIKPLLDQFSEQTGIHVNLVTGKADALLERLKSEGRNSPADLFLTVDAGRLHRAKEAGVLKPVRSSLLDAAVPAAFRDPDGYWYALSVRARPIMYATDRVDPGDLSTYEDLADGRWYGRICVRSSENIYNQSLVASMVVAGGSERTQQWADGLVRNFARAPKGGDRDQIRAAAAGQCDLAIANTYYLGQMLGSDDERDREAAQQVAVFWPNQQDRGAHVNVSGAALTASSKNEAHAVRLLEYLLGDPAQSWYAEANSEYPVVSGVAPSALVSSFGEFKADGVNLARLGEHNAEAVRIMDRAGWK